MIGNDTLFEVRSGMKAGIVANYPPKGAKHTNGSAPYSKNLAISLASNGIKLTIFANRLDSGRNEYTENNVRVVRCWKRGIFYLLQILRGIWRHRTEIDIVHIQHEYFYYGKTLTAILFPFMLLLLKSLRKPIVVTLHGVISLSDFGNTFAKENSLKGNHRVLKFGLSFVTKLISRLARKIIVHESFLAEVLVQEYGIKREKVAVIHHGIEEDKPADQEKSKQILGLQGKKVAMFFGYFSGYKGLHILIDSFADLTAKDYTLIVAGEENPRLIGSPEYRDYVRSLMEKASHTCGHIRFVGFVPEEQMPIYFAAADVVVLPYTSVMSACGPLTQCVTYRRPFLLSEHFRAIVDDEELLFRNNPEDLKNKIEEFFANKWLAEKSLRYGEKLFQERSWGRVVRDTAELYRGLLRHKEGLLAVYSV